MENKYMKYADKLQDLIDLEYPSQKLYPGIIQDIYNLTKRIGRGENIDNISFFSLARRFVDELFTQEELETLIPLAEQKWIDWRGKLPDDYVSPLK